MLINKPAPTFTADAYHDAKIKKISLTDYKGKWVVLVFYPADFTFVCPTELGDIAKQYSEFKKLNAEILSISVDTAFVHKAWHDTSPTISTIQYPMLADTSKTICTAYDTLNAEGMSYRATVLIDTKGIVKWFDIHNNSIGRNTQEILRRLQAAIYVSKHPDEVCPVSWVPGKPTLKPMIELVGKI